MRPRPSSYVCTALCLFFSFFSANAFTQEVPVQPRIAQAVDETNLTTLRGNTHPLARTLYDRGVAPASIPLDRILLVLKRSPEQDAALVQLLDEQQDKSSSNYHKWLTPEEFGKRFGPADSDIQAVTAWLQTHGFKVDQVSKGRSVIEFSGTAAMVQESFHATMHKYVVAGESHWANANDPQIPAALAPVVSGVWSLHNFRKKPQSQLAAQRIEAKVASPTSHPEFTSGSGLHALMPADYYVIYNITPRFGISGSIGIVGRSNINLQDVTYFHYWTFDQAMQPTVIVNGPDPGDLGGGEEVEAVLDTTWSGAVSPSAAVYLVVSASTNSTDGVDLSELYLIDNNLTDVMSESFGGCEIGVTSAEAAGLASLAQQAAAQGITYVVATGDSGSAGCDDPNTEAQATHPPSVNVLASNAYTVAVGGTMFNENGRPSSYWKATNDTPTLGSAISYIPENVWNESCAGTKCGTVKPNIWAGGGGASTLYPKPNWQFGVAGIPPDNARDLPDVSLTAGGHDPYLLCVRGSCIPDSQNRISFAAVGGTSASTPAFAGIMSMVTGATGSRQGQANYVLYRLAAAENLTQCNGSNTAGLPAPTCVFNDTTVGNNAVPGEAAYGTASAKYPAGKGYDLATGLGSINVNNLVSQWSSVNFLPTKTNFSISPLTATHGAPFAITINVSALNPPGTPAGTVWLQGGSSRGNLIGDSTKATFLLDASGSISATTHVLPGGFYSVNAHYAGDGTFAPSDSLPPISLNIQPEPSTTTVSVLSPDAGGNLVPFSTGQYGTRVYLKAHVAGQSGYGMPTMWVNFYDNASTGISSQVYLDGHGDALSPAVTQLSAGPHAISGGYYGDSSFSSSISSPTSVTINKAATTTSVQASSPAVPSGSLATFTVSVDSTSYGNPPSGNVLFFNGGTQLPGNATLVPGVNASTGTAQGVATYQATLPDGQASITAQYTADPNYTGSSSTAISVNVAPDFSLNLDATSGSVMKISSPGSSGTLIIHVVGSTGYTGTVNFAATACAGLPSRATCSFNPSSVTGSGSTTLTIATAAPHALFPTGPTARGSLLSTFGLTLAGVVVLTAPRRRRLTSVLGLLLLAWLMTFSGCGGGSSSGSGNGGGIPGTPVGSYTVTVTGADANFSRQLVFTLNVQ